MDFRRRPFNQKPLALGEIQKPIWRYFVMKLPSHWPSHVEKSTFWSFVRPDPAKVRDNIFVWSVRSPRTPLDLPSLNPNYQKTSFCEKLDFCRFTNRCLDCSLRSFWSTWALLWRTCSKPRWMSPGTDAHVAMHGSPFAQPVISRHLLVKLEKSSFSQKLFFS